MFGDTVRVEIGPQIVEVVCEDKSLDGKWDSMGKTVEYGKKMSIVDGSAKHKPYLWKVYKLQDVDGTDRFIKANEFLELSDALSFAETLGDK